MSDAFGNLEYGTILLVKVVEDHTGSFPTGVRCAYKCLICTPNPVFGVDSPKEGDLLNIQEPVTNDRYIIAYNFRNNSIPINTYHLAFKVFGYYLLDNQNAFLEAL